jgi:putative RNA 2'-phosphotransferase
MSSAITATSKFLSFLLRHKPEAIGLSLDANGWADVDELIRLANRSGRHMTRELLERVVAEDDKKRYALSADGRKIRANQGHSVDVDLNLPITLPPEHLYHGTASRFLQAIRQEGLFARSRRHVHLSSDLAVAEMVGRRHGDPVVLIVRARAMATDGHRFFLSANAVWLTECVPVEYLVFPDTSGAGDD